MRVRWQGCTRPLERQAVTDELTRLANVRALTSILDRELDPLRQSLIAAADAALYRAKCGGKDRVDRALTLMPKPSSRPR